MNDKNKILEWLIHQEHETIIISYAANNRAPKYMKKNPKLSEWKIAIIVGDFSIQPFLKLKWNSYKIKLTI